MPCVRDFYTEDNDTEDEDEGTEEEKANNQRMLDHLSSMLTDRPANMRDLKKGFVFFMDQEKREIKKLVAMSNVRKMHI